MTIASIRKSTMPPLQREEVYRRKERKLYCQFFILNSSTVQPIILTLAVPSLVNSTAIKQKHHSCYTIFSSISHNRNLSANFPPRITHFSNDNSFVNYFEEKYVHSHNYFTAYYIALRILREESKLQEIFSEESTIIFASSFTRGEFLLFIRFITTPKLPPTKEPYALRSSADL